MYIRDTMPKIPKKTKWPKGLKGKLNAAARKAERDAENKAIRDAIQAARTALNSGSAAAIKAAKKKVDDLKK